MKLISGAGQRYWSRRPGKYVNPATGEDAPSYHLFDGTVLDWYRTLLITMQDGLTDLGKPESVVVGYLPSFLLECLPEFKPLPEETGNRNADFRAMGSVDLGNKPYKIYSSKYLPEDMLYICQYDGKYTSIKVLD